MDAMAWFPYKPRPHQDHAIRFATQVFKQKTVGLLSADCGVGKTIAVLSGYFAARANDPESKLIVLTRTHSQACVFESELRVLNETEAAKKLSFHLTATSMVSRIHVCPMKAEIQQTSVAGFTRGCAAMIRSGECNYYYNMFIGNSNSGNLKLRESARDDLVNTLNGDVVTQETAENLSFSSGYCPYEVLRWSARNSRVVIGPYSYLFQERVRNAFLRALNVDLSDIDLIVDEAHNLADHVLEVESAQISGKDLLWLKENRDALDVTTNASWLFDVIDFLWETFMLNLDKIRNKNEHALNRWEILPRFVDMDELAQLLYRNQDNSDPTDGESYSSTPLERLFDILQAGHRATLSNDWHITIELSRSWDRSVSIENAVLKARPLNAMGFTTPILRGARSALLMSGTLNPLNHYASLLGIPSARTAHLTSPYEKGTRLVLLDKHLTTKYTERGSELWRAIAERISVALTTTPANKSALVAFPSYRIMNEVLSYNIDCGHRSRIVEDPKAQLDDLRRAVDETPHAIFAVYGGKFSEGIDLVKDGSSQINLIIGVGIPFSPPTSFHRALQLWFDERYGSGSGYYYSIVVPSIRRVAQLIGRLRRSPTDRGIVILFDKRFHNYLNVFGSDIISDIWPFESKDEMVSAIETFISGNRGSI